MPGRSDFWTPRRIAALANLVADGLTSKEIAKRIGDGCTKNMVIGRMHRTGGQLLVAPLQPPPTLDQRLRFDRVQQRGCVWIIGDPQAEWEWCGAKLEMPGMPYCAHHAKESRNSRQGWQATSVSEVPTFSTGKAMGLSRASILDD